MTHKGTIRIETPRLILRSFRTDDAHDMFANWASDPEVTRYLTWGPYTDEGAAEDFCAAREALADMPQIYEWVIEYRENGHAIGSISLMNIKERSECGELGYCLSRDYWNRGIMSEAVSAILDYAFDGLGMYRISARHDVGNPASGKVMRKCGMSFEGIMRGRSMNRSGEHTDCALYAVIRTDRKK